MFELFIALFGGTYLFSKYHSEQKQKINAEKRLNYRTEFMDNFNKIHSADSGVWHKFIMDMEYGYITPEEVYDVIGDDLKEVFGDDYKTKFPLPGMELYNEFEKIARKKAQPDAYNPVCWAAHLWLSKQGKIRYQDCLSAIPLGKSPKETIELCKIIERNIRRSGNNISLVAIPGLHRKVLLPDYSDSDMVVYECMNYCLPGRNAKEYRRLW